MRKHILVYGSEESVPSLRAIAAQLTTKVDTARNHQEIAKKIKSFNPTLLILDVDHEESSPNLLSPSLLQMIRASQKEWIVVSSARDPEAPWEAKKLGALDYVLKPYNIREFILRLNAVFQKKKRIVCLGGGTGLFTLLLGLKKLPNVLLASIVSMSDDGGSSGKLRASFGILPPGDIRRSLVALSNAPELMNRVIQYRFQKGEALQNHSFGNLFLTALAEIKGSMLEAVRALGDILNIQGIVLPVTTTLTDLVARFEDGTLVRGESKIDLSEGRNPDLRITQLWHEPEPECNPDAHTFLIYSDLVVIGPGDLFTSVVANLCIPGIRHALSKTRAKKVYLCNLMTKPGETAHYTAYDHVKEILKYLGGDYLDYVFLSNTRFSNEAILEYAKKAQAPVLAQGVKEIQKITKAQVILADLGNEEELVRHDSEKIQNAIRGVS